MKLAELILERAGFEEAMEGNTQALTDLLFPPFKAAGCNIIPGERLDSVEVKGLNVLLTTRYWAGEGMELCTYILPTAVFEDEDPVEAAEQVRLREVAAEEERRYQQHLIEIAALEKKLNRLKGQV